MYMVYCFFYVKFFGKYFLYKDKKSFWLGKLIGCKCFWVVVVQIEFIDIVFFIDLVLVVFVVFNNLVIVLIGGLIGILCMWGIVEFIMCLMWKVLELEFMVYVLIVVIVVKLFLMILVIDIEILLGFFGIFILLVFVLIGVVYFFCWGKYLVFLSKLVGGKKDGISGI